jgi:hypothetical protein
VRTPVAAVASRPGRDGAVDADLVVAHDLAHAAAAVENAAAVLEYGERGADEACIACALVADAGYELATRTA